MEIIVGKKGNQRTPITDEYVSREHCKLKSQSDGTYIIENLSRNGTFVDGRKILKTQVTSDTIIQLGPNFKVKVGDLIPIPRSGENGVRKYSIKSLKEVWEEYDNRITAIQKEQQTTMLLRNASPVFTLGSGAIAGLAKNFGWGDEIIVMTLIMTIIGLILVIYSFCSGYKNQSNKKQKEAIKYLQDNYLCPNPECKHYVGLKDYNILRQDKKCPYCGCKYTEQ